MKKTIRFISGCAALMCIGIMSALVYWSYQLPDSFQVEQGNSLHVDNAVAIAKPFDTSQAVSKSLNADVGETYPVTLHWLGLFPIKDVTVSVVEKGTVVLGGIPFGIKLYSDGVMVVSLSEVDTAYGNRSPAKKAGIKVGDLILSVDGTIVLTNEDVADAVKRSAGKTMTFRVRRDGVDFDISFCAEKSQKENSYKAGLWVRDSSAGIGTMTFYDPAGNVFAGLGHAVCDVDTGDVIPLSSGEIVPARIYGVTKSAVGKPGELRGGFDNGTLGSLCINCDRGVYAQVNGNAIEGERLSLMLKQDVKTGAARIYTTISGNTPQWYDIQITQIRYRDTTGTRSMVVEITDPELLSKTGGIVQGMSGTPIVQDGKLVGAITHVFVNNPTKGYAIFAENMLETAQRASKGQSKRAS